MAQAAADKIEREIEMFGENFERFVPEDEAAPAAPTATSDGPAKPVEKAKKGKGKARARVLPKPAIEAEHEWRCPIAGCGRLHYSVRIEGGWRNDEGRGAIALFV